MSEEKASNVIKIQLEPGEEIISQIKWLGADITATNKRVLRVPSTGTGIEALEYKDISSIKRKSSIKRTIISRILLAILLFVGCPGAIAIGWLGYFDGDFSLIITVILSICLVFVAVFALIGMLFYKYGYYKIESPKITKNMVKYWAVVNPFWGEEKITRFFQELSKHSGIPIKQE